MASVICRLFGWIILLAVIAALVPVTVPRFMGYEIYNVVSGMESVVSIGARHQTILYNYDNTRVCTKSLNNKGVYCKIIGYILGKTGAQQGLGLRI